MAEDQAVASRRWPWLAGGTLAVTILIALQVQAFETAREARDAIVSAHRLGLLIAQNTTSVRSISERIAANRERLAKAERDIAYTQRLLRSLDSESLREAAARETCIIDKAGTHVCGTLAGDQQ